MRIRFLGTGAAEGVPAIFCNCPVCNEARRNHGKCVRKRAAILVNDDMCVDFGPDIVQAFEEESVNGLELEHLLVTHAHFDHFYPENIETRGKRYLKREIPKLNIYGNQSVFDSLDRIGVCDDEVKIQRHLLKHGDDVKVGRYQVKAISANHAHSTGGAFNYCISDGNVSMLYATDTGPYSREIYECFADQTFDIVVFDATNIFLNKSRNHLTLSSMREMLDIFSRIGCIKKDAVILGTHFSHTGYENFAHFDLLKNYGIHAAWDGLEICI